MKKTLITFSLLLATSVVVFSQTLLSKDEFKTQRFGQEILYKDLQNGLLDGHYKIADSRGNYSDLYFKQGKKDGKNIDYDCKGRVLKTVTYKNGKAEGNYVTYHQNGKIRKQGAFNKGEEEGKWQVFNDKGELKTVESYKNGKKHGKWWRKIYYGQFQSYAEITEHYKNNEYVGHAEERSEDGKLKWEREYTNNLSYINKEYYLNGNLYIIEKFIEGKLNGEKATYNQDGILLEKLTFKDDQLQQAMAFYENGHKKTIYHFKHGKKYGLFQRFNEDEMLLKEGEYRDDYQNGIWKEFDYTDGALLFETSYKESVKNGIAKEYNKANRIAKEGHYKNNKKDGLWKHYNLAGKLVKEVVYNLGKKISAKEFN